MISRAADILRVLALQSDGLSLGQIANRVELPRSTVQRIVSALVAEGFVHSDGSSRSLRLGPEIRSLAQASAGDVKERMRPILRDIANRTGETVDLAVLKRGRMHFIDQIVGSHRLRTVSSIGDSFPLTTTANGKAALACLDQAEAARLVLSELESEGDENRLMPVLAELETIRSGALATDEDEHTEGVSAIGFAVRDTAGDVIAVSVPVPTSRYPKVREKLARVLSETKSLLR
ncbi:IclR family transcriptional regulator [Silicimonas sp. MF1-12-2]|uniref:IclR family transcriptional regulator n=1 Tax=Silicimonas sp. MF1-12-2 TaxID=3384793 RepID=UPI0039B6688B